MEKGPSYMSTFVTQLLLLQTTMNEKCRRLNKDPLGKQPGSGTLEIECKYSIDPEVGERFM
jgi:hypothetical protein